MQPQRVISYHDLIDGRHLILTCGHQTVVSYTGNPSVTHYCMGRIVNCWSCPDIKVLDNQNQAIPTIPTNKPMSGSPIFYALLDSMATLHAKKSHDYASNDNPFGNYHFAGKLAKLFNNPEDSGFVGRLGEKLYRLANLENEGKEPSNESIEDTELDMCVIMTLWMADRRQRRINDYKNQLILDNPTQKDPTEQETSEGHKENPEKWKFLE